VHESTAQVKLDSGNYTEVIKYLTVKVIKCLYPANSRSLPSNQIQNSKFQVSGIDSRIMGQVVYLSSTLPLELIT
jgi:hypothetical protein